MKIRDVRPNTPHIRYTRDQINRQPKLHGNYKARIVLSKLNDLDGGNGAYMRIEKIAEACGMTYGEAHSALWRTKKAGLWVALGYTEYGCVRRRLTLDPVDTTKNCAVVETRYANGVTTRRRVKKKEHYQIVAAAAVSVQLSAPQAVLNSRIEQENNTPLPPSNEGGSQNLFLAEKLTGDNTSVSRETPPPGVVPTQQPQPEPPATLARASRDWIGEFNKLPSSPALLKLFNLNKVDRSSARSIVKRVRDGRLSDETISLAIEHLDKLPRETTHPGRRPVSLRDFIKRSSAILQTVLGFEVPQVLKRLSEDLATAQRKHTSADAFRALTTAGQELKKLKYTSFRQYAEKQGPLHLAWVFAYHFHSRGEGIANDPISSVHLLQALTHCPESIDWAKLHLKTDLLAISGYSEDDVWTIRSTVEEEITECQHELQTTPSFDLVLARRRLGAQGYLWAVTQQFSADRTLPFLLPMPAPVAA